LLITLGFKKQGVNSYNGLNAQYCTPGYTTGCEFGDGLTQFHLNTINQAVPCADIPNYYHDYTGISTDLAKNGYYILSGQSINTNFYISVWIDYNVNTIFESGTELIGSFSFNNLGGTFSIPFTVPGTAPTGPTRLRIMSSTNGLITNPCNDPGPGNGCDFAVNIVAPVTAPTVITQGATGVTPTASVLNGSVNAYNSTTYVEFHYGLDVLYGNTINAIPGTVTGNSATSVSSSITGLLPNTTYHYEVVGHGAGGYISGGDVTFTTNPLPPPNVTTLPATVITGSAAILNGTVNANGSASSVSFEYGTDISYGRTITGNPSSVNSNIAEPIIASITGLDLNTTYHYRIISTNAAGTSYGGDLTFSTWATPYCIPVYSTGCNYYNMGLSFFGLNTISQAISCTGSPNYYHDFTTSSTDLALNGSYSISVQAAGGYGVYITIWIDYNHNNVFDGVSEIAGQGHCSGGYSSAIPITVSGSSLTGSTWLRAMTRYDYYGYPSDPCSVSEIYGNCSDFSVNILSAATLATITSTAPTGVTGSGATLNATVNANGFSTAVKFDYGLTTAYGTSLTATPGIVSGISPISVNTTIGGLLPNTIYHFKARGDNAAGITFGEDIGFTTSPVAPVVTTISANLVTGLSASLNGSVNPNNSTSSVSFEYGLTTSYGMTVVANPSSVSGYAVQSVAASVAGLTLNTLYHYRIISTNAGGTSYGDDMTFTTLPSPYCIPVYSTGCNYYNMGLSFFGLNTISQVISCAGSPNYYHDFTASSTELALNGTYSISVQAAGGYGLYITIWIDYNQNGVFEGASEIAGQGHCYGSASSTIPITIAGTALTGSTWLRAMTKYDYYGYPSDPCSISEYYGNCSDFTINILSSATLASVNTMAATGISVSGATLNANVNANGYPALVTFDYGLTTVYGTSLSGTPGIVTGTSPADVNTIIGGLLPNTAYHFRARADNAGGITFGDDVTFTTNPPPPVVSTAGATLITGISASLNGTVNPNNSTAAISFEYGLTTSYGNTVAGDPSSVSGYSTQSATVPIAGLTLNSLYHYRIVSTNAGGTSYGDDMTFTTLPTPYCIPIYAYGCNYYNMGLTYFGLNTISQTISCSGTPNYYHDFTSSSVDLVLNGSYSMLVQAGGGYGVYITVWIDYNQNGIFDGAGEVVGQGHCNGSASSTIPFTVAGTALTGSTWLRAMTRYDYYGYPSDPCSVSEIYGNCSDFTVNILSSATLATVTTVSATGLAGSGAILNATINANGFTTASTFDYGLTTTYGTSLSSTPAFVSGISPTDVNATIGGLLPNTVYHFRARGDNAAGIILGNDLTFTSSQIPPIVTTGGVNNLGGTSVIINGTVDANNSTSDVAFEYGLTTSYGSTVAGNPATISGHTAQPASAFINGLDYNTIYHYRMISTNAGGASSGADMTFQTLSTPYCIPVYAYGCNYYNMGLSYFGLNTISQPISCAGTPNYYHDYTSTSTEIALNGSYSVSVQAGGGYGIYITIWIDYNHNNVFDGADEVAGQGHCNGGVSSTIPITVAGSALTGLTGLRVMSEYDAYGVYPSNPCSASMVYGNCSDFTVNILPSAPPVVATAPATSVTGSSSTVHGFVNALGFSTAVTFEYGLTASYGTTVDGIPSPVTGGISTPVGGSITGLLPNKTYHFRIIGTSLTGTVTGSDMTFNTLSSTTTQTLTTGMPLGSLNQQIIGIEILNPNASNPVEATSFTFNTNGTTQLSDISNAKLFYTGTSGTFATGMQFGSAVTYFDPLSAFFGFTGSQALSTGNNHFWLTYDISPVGTGGHYADAECTSVTVGNALVPIITAPAGNRIITDDKFLESISVSQASTASVLKGSQDNEILMLDFNVTGTTSICYEIKFPIAGLIV
jgi:hypothetical protein